jgi:hypothetical protein
MLRGLRDGRQDAADGVPAKKIGRDADYTKGYETGYAEMTSVAEDRAKIDRITKLLRSVFPNDSNAKLFAIARRAVKK